MVMIVNKSQFTMKMYKKEFALTGSALTLFVIITHYMFFVLVLYKGGLIKKESYVGIGLFTIYLLYSDTYKVYKVSKRFIVSVFIAFVVGYYYKNLIRMII
tara:strand:- start:325 stop:627 length:303 start_codon:yes stop_codon:yes gene_type:complete